MPAPLDRARERRHRVDPAREVLDDLDLRMRPRPEPAEELHDDPLADDVGRVRLVDADGPLGLRRARASRPMRRIRHAGMFRDCPHHDRGRHRPLRPDVAMGAVHEQDRDGRAAAEVEPVLELDRRIAAALPPNQRAAASSSAVGRGIPAVTCELPWSGGEATASRGGRDSGRGGDPVAGRRCGGAGADRGRRRRHRVRAGRRRSRPRPAARSKTSDLFVGEPGHQGRPGARRRAVRDRRARRLPGRLRRTAGAARSRRPTPSPETTSTRREPTAPATSPTSARGPATPTKGWYSFNVGQWHLIALNANCTPRRRVRPVVATDDLAREATSPPTIRRARSPTGTRPGSRPARTATSPTTTRSGRCSTPTTSTSSSPATTTSTSATPSRRPPRCATRSTASASSWWAPAAGSLDPFAGAVHERPVPPEHAVRRAQADAASALVRVAVREHRQARPGQRPDQLPLVRAGDTLDQAGRGDGARGSPGGGPRSRRAGAGGPRRRAAGRSPRTSRPARTRTCARRAPNPVSSTRWALSY